MTKDKYKLIRNVCLCLGAIIFIGLMLWSFFGNMELFVTDKHHGYDSYLQWYLESRFAYELAFSFFASMIPVGVARLCILHVRKIDNNQLTLTCKMQVRVSF